MDRVTRVVGLDHRECDVVLEVVRALHPLRDVERHDEVAGRELTHLLAERVPHVGREPLLVERGDQLLRAGDAHVRGVEARLRSPHAGLGRLPLERRLVLRRCERQAAEARVRASQASLDAAGVRVAGALELVAAFDQQRFTPDVWNALGERMNELSQRYLVMALDIAKRMQRAYNFENDVR